MGERHPSSSSSTIMVGSTRITLKFFKLSLKSPPIGEPGDLSDFRSFLLIYILTLFFLLFFEYEKYLFALTIFSVCLGTNTFLITWSMSNCKGNFLCCLTFLRHYFVGSTSKWEHSSASLKFSHRSQSISGFDWVIILFLSSKSDGLESESFWIILTAKGFVNSC